MVDLSVNVNKIALIRNARGHNMPNLLEVAQDCVRFGADGITVHPRPDERHIRKADVYELKEALSVELNVEGFPSQEFLKMVEEVKPTQCTLVPDSPEALTSNAGWHTIKHKHFLLEVIQRLQAIGIRTSIFVETDLELIEGAREIGTDRIELYTEAYANQFGKDKEVAVAPYARAAAFAHEIGLGVNAGHDLNSHNLSYFAEALPALQDVSIGHALVCDALYIGLKETIRQYQLCLGKKLSELSNLHPQ